MAAVNLPLGGGARVDGEKITIIIWKIWSISNLKEKKKKGLYHICSHLALFIQKKKKNGGMKDPSLAAVTPFCKAVLKMTGSGKG
ncbi:hypothetical protein P7M16_23670 [Vibrio parahaemolyticus]|nr:hypothetical protein [Vibrio parahaemolyticus]